MPTTMTDEERRARCLRNESDTYRIAIIRLLSMADTGGRKTIDKADVLRVAVEAYDEGNRWHRRSKGEDL